MAADKRTAFNVPTGILARTTDPQEPVESAEGQGGDAPAAQGDENRPSRGRRKRTTTAKAEKLEGRRLYLSDGVFRRLKLEAMHKDRKLSEVAEEILDRNLPRFRLEREG